MVSCSPKVRSLFSPFSSLSSRSSRRLLADYPSSPFHRFRLVPSLRSQRHRHLPLNLQESRRRSHGSYDLHRHSRFGRSFRSLRSNARSDHLHEQRRQHASCWVPLAFETWRKAHQYVRASLSLSRVFDLTPRVVFRLVLVVSFRSPVVGVPEGPLPLPVFPLVRLTHLSPPISTFPSHLSFSSLNPH